MKWPFDIRNIVIAICGVFLTLLIRKGGRDAERQKNTEATLDNVAVAKQVQDTLTGMSDAKRKRMRKKWTPPKE